MMNDRLALELLRTIRAAANPRTVHSEKVCVLIHEFMERFFGDMTVKVRLISYNDRKIAAIKTVRNWISLGLKESKDLVESAPVVIDVPLNVNDARKFVEEFRKSGAEAEITF